MFNDANPVHADVDWPPAVISGAYRTGVLGVRSLVRRGVRTTSFDTNRAYPGFRSVYGRAHACPDPDTEPERWVDFMIDLSARMGGKPVLIASADVFVSAIAAHASTLGAHYVCRPGVPLPRGCWQQSRPSMSLPPNMASLHATDHVREIGRRARGVCEQRAVPLPVETDSFSRVAGIPVRPSAFPCKSRDRPNARPIAR